MSLIRMVLRMSTVAALRGRTWAGSRVYDSDSTPLLDALANQTKPYITVFTDEDVRSELFGRDLYTPNRAISLVFEFGIASAARVDNGDTQLSIPQTDQGMEALVDICEMQIIAAAMSDPNSPFAEINRQIINSIGRAPSIRGGSSERTTRWAARQLTLVCSTISDPAPGVVLDSSHPIKQFVTLAQSSEHASLKMAEGANMVLQVLNAMEAPEWQQGQAWLGLTKAGIWGTGIVPMPDGDLEGHEFNYPHPEPDDTIPEQWPDAPRDDQTEPPEIPEES